MPELAELAEVRVNAVASVVVDTSWWSFLPEEQRRAEFDSAVQTIPTRRIGKPEDVAAIRYLIAATYATGTIPPVDGGVIVA